MQKKLGKTKIKKIINSIFALLFAIIIIGILIGFIENNVEEKTITAVAFLIGVNQIFEMLYPDTKNEEILRELKEIKEIISKNK